MTEIKTDINQIQINSLNHITGQTQAVELLKLSIDAYFQSRSKNCNGSTFGPVLLVGPSGTGKTLIAKAVHQELANLKLLETNGEMLNHQAELVSMLIDADENTTIFIDEAQAINTKNQHILLTAISERKIYIPSSNTKSKKFTIPLANFVLILASTHEYQLQDALRNRMRIYCRFDYYNLNDLFLITKQRSDALCWNYDSDEVILEVSRRAKQTPRLALNRNLQMAYNVSISNDRDTITISDVYEAFQLLQIDSLGLDSIERAYLQELSKHETMKLNVLASKLGLPRQTVVNVLEPYLLRIELIEKQGSDRLITEKGKNHILNSEFMARS